MRPRLLGLVVVVIGYLLSPLPASAAETLHYLHQDHLGSTALVTDSTGNVVDQEVYYPYGSTRNQLLATGYPLTTRKYTGQVSDVEETSLYYYNARYYSPSVGKFTSADTFNDGLNRYAYVGNNPIILVDPSGHQGLTQPSIGYECTNPATCSTGDQFPWTQEYWWKKAIETGVLDAQTQYIMDIGYMTRPEDDIWLQGIAALNEKNARIFDEYANSMFFGSWFSVVSDMGLISASEYYDTGRPTFSNDGTILNLAGQDIGPSTASLGVFAMMGFIPAGVNEFRTVERIGIHEFGHAWEALNNQIPISHVTLGTNVSGEATGLAYVNFPTFITGSIDDYWRKVGKIYAAGTAAELAVYGDTMLRQVATSTDLIWYNQARAMIGSERTLTETALMIGSNMRYSKQFPKFLRLISTVTKEVLALPPGTTNIYSAKYIKNALFR